MSDGQSIHQIMQEQVSAKIALALMDTLTAERIKSLVDEQLRKTESGWGYKPFLEVVISRAIEDAIRAEVTKKVEEKQEIINAAVAKAIGPEFVAAICESIKIDLRDQLSVIIQGRKKYE